MSTTRHLTRLGATTLAATWLLTAAGVTSASAAPIPPDPGAAPPAVSAAMPRPGTAYGGGHGAYDEAREHGGLYLRKARVYDEYLARDDARAASAARLPSLPTIPAMQPMTHASHPAAQTRSSASGGAPVWTLGVAGATGLVLGAGLMGAGTRLRRAGHGRPATA